MDNTHETEFVKMVAEQLLPYLFKQGAQETEKKTETASKEN